MKKYPTLEGICGDAGYRKTFEEEMESLGLTADIVERIQGAGWTILIKRWGKIPTSVFYPNVDDTML